MTRQELKDLIERHTDIQRCADSDPDWWIEQADHRDMERAHKDRGALLDLARQLEAALASLQPDFCPLCGDPECPAPMLDVLRGDAEEENDR